jgi:hypothetical protein
MWTHPEPNNFAATDGQLSMDWLDFEDEAEKVQHESALVALSQQFPEEEELVRDLYQQKLREFMPEATIRTFVSIFVTRDVKGTLKRLHREHPELH